MNLPGRRRCDIDEKDTSGSKRHEEASGLMMPSQRTSGLFFAAQFTGRGCIAVLALCLGVCFVPGGLDVVAQVADSPVASIESLVRSEQFDQALQLTKSQLHIKPNDVRLWTLEIGTAHV